MDFSHALQNLILCLTTVGGSFHSRITRLYHPHPCSKQFLCLLDQALTVFTSMIFPPVGRHNSNLQGCKCRGVVSFFI